ncbi:MAG: hypothetical protein WC978_00200 [bacterium]
MRITVDKILPCDDINDYPRMKAVVSFYEDKTDKDYHRSADVIVFFDKHDAPLSQLKSEAIQAAIDFLKLALSDRS